MPTMTLTESAILICGDSYEFDELAGLYEYDGGMSRQVAEMKAYADIRNKYKKKPKQESIFGD